MSKPTIQRFDTRAAFHEHLAAVLGRARVTLDLFDPDFALFALGRSDMDAALRRFLHDGGRLRLAMHCPALLERDAPRLLRVLRDFAHAVECRTTPSALRQLSDSFCIADDLHVVRRFHSDHLRGAVAFDAAQETEVPRARFTAIWAESLPGLQASVTGL
jgi:hypothetical protein